MQIIASEPAAFLQHLGPAGEYRQNWSGDAVSLALLSQISRNGGHPLVRIICTAPKRGSFVGAHHLYCSAVSTERSGDEEMR